MHAEIGAAIRTARGMTSSAKLSVDTSSTHRSCIDRNSSGSAWSSTTTPNEQSPGAPPSRPRLRIQPGDAVQSRAGRSNAQLIRVPVVDVGTRDYTAAFSRRPATTRTSSWTPLLTADLPPPHGRRPRRQQIPVALVGIPCIDCWRRGSADERRSRKAGPEGLALRRPWARDHGR